MRNFRSSFYDSIKSKQNVLLSAHAAFFKKICFALLLFIICYCCIFAFLSIKKNIEIKFQNMIVMLEENNIQITNPQLHFIFPALEFDTLVHAAYPDIIIEKGKLELSLWNKEINFIGTLAQGKITALVTLDALFSPRQLTAQTVFENINLKNIKNSLPLQSIIGINAGIANLNTSLTIQLQNLKPKLSSLKAACKGNIANAAVTNYIPILKSSDISNGELTIDLQLNKTKLDYCNISFNSNILSADITGTASLNYNNFRQSALNLNSVVKIDKNAINQELTPPNTRKSILEKNEVRMKITGSVSSLKVNIL